MRRVCRLGVPALALLTLACSPSRHPAAQGSAEDQIVKMNFVLSKVCLPVIAHHVSFDQIIANYQLKKHVYCDIQSCLTWFCTVGPKPICLQPPSGGWCWTEVLYSNNFDKLNNIVFAILTSDGQKWQSVAPKPKIAGYERAFCDAGKSVIVSTAGFRRGDVIGYTPRPLHGFGRSEPMTAPGTEFDIHVRSVRNPDLCSPP
jgi:hypothetical protein